MNKQIKYGVFLQYIQMFLKITITLIYTPIMLKILGKSQFGIYNIAASLISYLSLLSLGFGAAYIRYYSRYKKNNDEFNIRRLNGLYLIVFSLIGVIALISGIALSQNVSLFFNTTYSKNDLNLSKILMIILSINLAISFPASLFESYVTSQERFIFQKSINIIKTVLSPSLSIVLLFLGYGAIGMVLMTTLTSIIVDIINIYYCFHKCNMKISFHNLDFSVLKEIAVFSSFIAINQVIDQINFQTDKIIIGKMIDGVAVAVYAIGSTFNTMFISISTAVSSVFVPTIHKIENLAIGNKEKNKIFTGIMTKVGRMQFVILALILTGFIFFGKYFIYKWAGDGFEDSYYIALLLITPMIIPLSQNIGIEIIRAKNKHKFRSIVFSFMAVLNIFISIIFCKWFGGIGCALGTTISLIIANIIIMNIYYQKVIKINVVSFWKNISSILPSLFFPIVFGIITFFINYDSMVVFLALILIYTIIYFISIYLFGLNDYEKHSIKKAFYRMIKRS